MLLGSFVTTNGPQLITANSSAYYQRLSTFSLVNKGLPSVNKGSIAGGDINNDGQQDFVVMGIIDGVTSLMIFLNNGTGYTYFQPPGVSGLSDGDVELVDYNNDGRLDLSMLGNDGGGTTRSLLYRNMGAFNGSIWQSVATPFVGLAFGSISWGDINQDGFFDVLMTGQDQSATPLTYLYANLGNGSFTQVMNNVGGAGMVGVTKSSSAICDWNRDGKPDVLIAGISGAQPVFIMYGNSGGFGMVDAQIVTVPGFHSGSLRCADFNGDNFNDVLVAGVNASGLPVTRVTFGPDVAGFSTSATVPFNLPVQYGPAALAVGLINVDLGNDLVIGGFDGTTLQADLYINSCSAPGPPSLPSLNPTPEFVGYNVSADVPNVDRYVKLSWTWTPGWTVTFNVFVGASSSTSEYLSPAAYLLDGKPRLFASGNAGTNTFTILRGIPAGATYYWSVMAQSNGFLTSNWATVRSFTTPVLPSSSPSPSASSSRSPTPSPSPTPSASSSSSPSSSPSMTPSASRTATPSSTPSPSSSNSASPSSSASLTPSRSPSPSFSPSSSTSSSPSTSPSISSSTSPSPSPSSSPSASPTPSMSSSSSGTQSASPSTTSSPSSSSSTSPTSSTSPSPSATPSASPSTTSSPSSSSSTSPTSSTSPSPSVSPSASSSNSPSNSSSRSSSSSSSPSSSVPPSSSMSSSPSATPSVSSSNSPSNSSSRSSSSTTSPSSSTPPSSSNSTSPSSSRSPSPSATRSASSSNSPSNSSSRSPSSTTSPSSSASPSKSSLPASSSSSSIPPSSSNSTSPSSSRSPSPSATPSASSSNSPSNSSSRSSSSSTSPSSSASPSKTSLSASSSSSSIPPSTSVSPSPSTSRSRSPSSTPSPTQEASPTRTSSPPSPSSNDKPPNSFPPSPSSVSPSTSASPSTSPFPIFASNFTRNDTGPGIVQEYYEYSPTTSLVPTQTFSDGGPRTVRRPEVAAGVRFNRIAETDELGYVVNWVDVPSSGWAFSRPTEFGGQEFQFSIVLDNGAEVVVHYAIFDRATSITYGNLTFVVPPYTSKWYIKITDWPFAESTNRLRLELAISSANGNFLQVNSDATGADESALRAATLSTRDSNVVINFPNFCLIDSLDTSGSVATAVRNSGAQVTFVFDFPHFDHFMLYDPNIGVLLSDNSDLSGTEQDTGGLSTSALALYIALPLVGGICILFWLVVLALFIVKKRKGFGTITRFMVNFDEEAEEPQIGEEEEAGGNQMEMRSSYTLRERVASEERLQEKQMERREKEQLRVEKDLMIGSTMTAKRPINPRATENVLYEQKRSVTNPLFEEEGDEMVELQQVTPKLPPPPKAPEGKRESRQAKIRRRPVFRDEEDVVYSDEEK